MCDLKQYIIALPTLGEGHHELELKADKDLFSGRGGTDVTDADITAYIDIDVRHGAYNIGLTCQGWIDIPCDRCLDPMRIGIDEDYDVCVRYGEEYEETDESITLPENEVNFDLAPLIADTVSLAIPLRHVHPEGECNKEMEEIMNQHSAAEDPEAEE
ncbi:MAG: DUF177 domain-containing protein [Muribaculaceae bacterium]|nr:DUF177 domain-containing protein [Muribaculaceae bacterium]